MIKNGRNILKLGSPLFTGEGEGKAPMKKFFLASVIVILLTISILANTRTVSSQLAQPEISVNPEVNNNPPPQQFTLDINITDVTIENGKNGLYGWEVDISFNASVLNATDVQEGPFLRNFWPPQITNTTFNVAIDNNAGTVVATCFYFPYPDFGAYIYGNDTLVYITFKVLSNGGCDLPIYKSELRTYWPTPPPGKIEVIDHTTRDGFFQYPRGDADFNGKVDVYDLYAVGIAYKTIPGNPNWNPNCDFNKDDKVDNSDLTDVSENYGKN